MFKYFKSVILVFLFLWSCTSPSFSVEKNENLKTEQNLESWRYSHRNLKTISFDLDFIKENFTQVDSLNLNKTYIKDPSKKISSKEFNELLYGLPYKTYEFENFRWLDTLNESSEQAFIEKSNEFNIPVFGEYCFKKNLFLVTFHIFIDQEKNAHNETFIFALNSKGRYKGGWNIYPNSLNLDYKVELNINSFTIYKTQQFEEESSENVWCFNDTIHLRYILKDEVLVRLFLKNISLKEKGNCDQKASR
jgi:hypothetical protein